MRATILGVLAAGLAVATATAGGDAAGKDAALLQGNWSVVLMEEKGNKAPDELLKGLAVEIKADKISVSEKGKLVIAFQYKLVDATKKTREIDLTHLSGDEKGQKELGIYQFDGDTVQFCTSEKGQERPKAFGTSKEDGRTLVILKRVK